jgi:type I restriction enzyme S subunit
MSFELTTLGEYARVQGGYAYKSKDFSDTGTCSVLKIKNVRFGNVNYADASFISEEIANETADWKTKEGDILISMTGSGPNAPQSLVGRVARVWGNEPVAWINQRVGRVVLKEERAIHPDFLYYLLSSPRSQDYLVSNSSGSANQANISGKTIESLPCPKVDYDQSAEIAKILRELDLKIIINRQTNQTLEQIAQAIFKSWFVDFEPVKAKIKAKQNGQSPELAAMCSISGKTEEQLKSLDEAALQQLKTIAALFPDVLVEPELDEIPEGWEVKKLKNICRVLNGRAYKNTEFKEKGIPIVRIQNLSNGGKGGKTVYSDLDLPIDKLIHKEDFIYAWSATFGPHIWRGSKSIYHYHIWKMDVNEELISRYFLFLSMFRKTEKMKSGATGSIFTHLTKSMMENQEILVATSELNLFFKEMLGDYFKKISAMDAEIEILVQLRDSLLPKLLSGELAISKVV